MPLATVRTLGVLLALCVVGALPLRAQITLPSSLETDRIGRTVTVATRLVQTDVSGLAAIDGANQTWDLSGLPFGAQATTINLDYLPFSGDLPAADVAPISTSDYVVRSEFRVADQVTTTYSYRALSNDSLSTTGSPSVGDANLDGTPDTTVVRNTPPLLDAVYPITFGAAWADSTTQRTQIPGLPTESESDVKIEVAVDGWGTVVTPDGSFACLRLSRTTTVSFFGSDFVTKTVELVTADGVTAVLDVTNGSASYSIATVGASAEDAPTSPMLHLDAAYPNPFSTTTRLAVTMPRATMATFVIYDVLGRRVATLEDGRLGAGTQSFAWTPDAALANGVYVAVLHADGQTVSRRLSLQR
ncbi:MAG: T9SS type A sorting domain-containing protein [Bacteroidota bacterium]